MSCTAKSIDEMVRYREIEDFVRESNRIEGIEGVRETELDEMVRFMALEYITVAELERFVMVYQPGARLRDRIGMDVTVGNHLPLKGGPQVREALNDLLTGLNHLSPFRIHRWYEHLHPFTDCNGRSGRALWAWMHRDLSKGFLREWYYQSLREID